MNWFKGVKPVGTIIQRRDGRNYVKTEKGWIAESRLTAEHKLVRRSLVEGEKVFHKDMGLIGTREFNQPNNLVVLKFNLTKYRLLPHPNIIYLPKERGLT